MSRRKKQTHLYTRGRESLKCWDKCMESFYSRPLAENSSPCLAPGDRNLNISWETTSSDSDEDEVPRAKTVLRRKPSVVTRLTFDSCENNSKEIFSRQHESKAALGSESEQFSVSCSNVPGVLHYPEGKCVLDCKYDSIAAEANEMKCSFGENETRRVQFEGCSDTRSVKEYSRSVQECSPDLASECSGCLSFTIQDIASSPSGGWKKKANGMGVVSPTFQSRQLKHNEVSKFVSNNSHACKSEVHDSGYTVFHQNSHLVTGITSKAYPASPILTPKNSRNFHTCEVANTFWRADTLVSSSVKSPVIKNLISEIESPTLGSGKHSKKLSLKMSEISSGESDTLLKIGSSHEKLIATELPIHLEPDKGFCSESSLKAKKKESCRNLFETVLKKLKSKQSHSHIFRSKIEQCRNNLVKRKTRDRRKFKCKMLLKQPLTTSEGQSSAKPGKVPPRKFRASHNAETPVKLSPQSILQPTSPVLHLVVVPDTVLQGPSLELVESVTNTKPVDYLKIQSVKSHLSTYMDTPSAIVASGESIDASGGKLFSKNVDILKTNVNTYLNLPVVSRKFSGSPIASRKCPESPVMSRKCPESPVMSRKCPDSPVISRKCPESPVVSRKFPESPLVSRNYSNSPIVCRKHPGSSILSKKYSDSPVGSTRCLNSAEVVRRYPDSPILGRRLRVMFATPKNISLSAKTLKNSDGCHLQNVETNWKCLPSAVKEPVIVPVTKDDNHFVNLGSRQFQDGTQLSVKFQVDHLVDTPQSSSLGGHTKETAFQTFITRTIKKVHEQRNEILRKTNAGHLMQTGDELESNSASSSSYVIESVPSQEVDASQKIEVSQSSSNSCTRRISPVLSQEMKQNQPTSSELSTVSSASSSQSRPPQLMSPVHTLLECNEQLLDMDSAKKKPRKRYKKGSLSARLHRLVKRQRSQANLWQYELSKPTSAWYSNPGKKDARSTVLAVQLCWQEYGRVLMRCSRVHATCSSVIDKVDSSVKYDQEEDDLNSSSSHDATVNSDVVLIIDPSIVQVSKLQPQSLIRIYPPWQVMDVPQLKVKVVMCLTHLDVLSSCEASQPTTALEMCISLQEYKCPCLEDSKRQTYASEKCPFQFKNKGAEFIQYIFPEASMGKNSRKLLPQSQIVGERCEGHDNGTIAEAVENYNCVLVDNIWLLVRIEKIFVYRTASYKLSGTPDREEEEEVTLQNNLQNLSWSVLCRDENDQFCEVILGPVPENFVSAENNFVPPVFYHSEKPESGDDIEMCCTVEQGKDVSVSHVSKVEHNSVKNCKINSISSVGCDGKPGMIYPMLSMDENGELRNLYKVECNDSEIEFCTALNSSELREKTSSCRDMNICHDSCDHASVNAAEQRSGFNCGWFWKALVSGKALQYVYKLSGLTLAKRSTRNKSLSTWALFCEASTLHSFCPAKNGTDKDSKTICSKNNEAEEMKVQPMFFVFSTCSDVLQVSKVLDSATNFPLSLSQPCVLLLADVMKQKCSEACIRCSMLIKLLVISRGYFYITDTSLTGDHPAGNYVIMSVSPSCYVPHKMTNGCLVFLKDVLFYKGNFSADRYTRILLLSNKLIDPFVANLMKDCNGSVQSLYSLVPTVPHLKLTSSSRDLISFSGNVVGVDEESAFAWPACAECDSEVLAELPSGRHFCRRCCSLVSTNTRMSLTVLLTCALLPLQSTVRVQLMQKTILELLSRTAKSDEGYDLATVLGQEIGPMICLVEKVQIGKNGETNFLLEQVPEICQ